jgi:hypothetical protein
VHRSFALVAGCLALLSACTSASTPPADGGGDDASDAGAADQAVMDAPPPDGGGPRFCAKASPPHEICDDFEDGGPAPDWMQNTCATCSLAGTMASAVSVPFALETKLTGRGADAGDPSYAVLRRSLTGAWKRTRVELDFRPKAATWQAMDANVGLVCVEHYSSSASGRTCVLLGRSSVDLVAFGALASAPAASADQWHHLLLEIDPATGSASMTIDGAKLSKAFAPLAPGTNVVTDVYVGLQGELQPTPELGVLYDNVTVDRF